MSGSGGAKGGGEGDLGGQASTLCVGRGFWNIHHGSTTFVGNKAPHRTIKAEEKGIYQMQLFWYFPGMQGRAVISGLEKWQKHLLVLECSVHAGRRSLPASQHAGQCL